jgi:hypothetical protein
MICLRNGSVMGALIHKNTRTLIHKNTLTLVHKHTCTLCLRNVWSINS